LTARWLPWLGLPAAVFALYAGTLHYPRVFDDLTYVPSVGAGLHRWLADETFRWIGANNPAERFANIALHAAVALTLFGFLERLFQVVLNGARSLAFFGALAFALHPVAVYGVAYLTQRSIVMATLFSLASVIIFLRGARERRLAIALERRRDELLQGLTGDRHAYLTDDAIRRRRPHENLVV